MIASEDATPPRLDELIGTADAARRHGLMPWDFTNAARRGELRAYKVPGNRLAFRREDVDAWASRKAADNETCIKSTPEGAT